MFYPRREYILKSIEDLSRNQSRLCQKSKILDQHFLINKNYPLEFFKIVLRNKLLPQSKFKLSMFSTQFRFDFLLALTALLNPYLNLQTLEFKFSFI